MPPCVTWHTPLESTGLWGNGKEKEGLELFYVTVWSLRREECRRCAEKIKEAISNQRGCFSPQISEAYEAVRRIWSRQLEFYHIKEDE